MSNQDARRWNDRYARDGALWQMRRPRQLLLDYAHLLPKTGLALDAASGVALHGLFLAARGLHVIALDVSEVGLRFALESARAQRVWLETAVVDLSHPWLPNHSFDVIVNFRFLERAAFPVYRRALKPGGLLIFETFLRTELDQDYPDHYLNPGELRNAFNGWEILHSAVVKQIKPDSDKRKVTEELIARKPLAIL